MIRILLDNRRAAILAQLVRGLPILDPITGPWVAGGSVRSVAVHSDLSDVHDIDVWFRNKTQLDAFEDRLKELAYESIGSPKGTRSYVTQWKKIIQLVTHRCYNSAEELIGDFSITACQFVTDGHHVWADSILSMTDAQNRVFNVTNPRCLSPSFVTKYLGDYGYQYDGNVDELMERACAGYMEERGGENPEVDDDISY